MFHSFEDELAVSNAMNAQTHIGKAVTLAVQYGQIDGAHHKTWVIDQILRILAGDQYESIIADAKAGVDGLDTYGWDEGIAP